MSNNPSFISAEAQPEPIFLDLYPKKAALAAIALEPTVSADKIKSILEKSYRDGYMQGIQDGNAAGLLIGEESLAKDKSLLAALVLKLNTSIDQKSELFADDVLALSLDIAKAMVKSNLNINHAVVVGVIKDAIGRLPALTKPIQLLINPLDAPVVIQHMEEDLHLSGWTIAEDPSVEVGGCKIETAFNTVDATNQTRWMLISEALGQNDDWLN
jgi:flagellar assembly protein FliH